MTFIPAPAGRRDMLQSPAWSRINTGKSRFSFSHDGVQNTQGRSERGILIPASDSKRHRVDDYSIVVHLKARRKSQSKQHTFDYSYLLMINNIT